MALQKPYNISLRGTTVDSQEDNIITWQVSGDIQTAYKIDILLNADNTLKWTSNKVTSYGLKSTLPKNSLQNGIEYKIKITIYNAAGDSITSDGDIFQTSSRPVITVDTMGTVNSFNYNFTAQYVQSEGVSLRNYSVNLYDAKKNLINNSAILTTLPMQYLFSDLQTETNYYIEFQATSSKGLTGTSGLVLFSVFYFRPRQYIDLTASNIDNAGIELSWYTRQIILKNDGGTFIDSEKMDVTSGTVTADDGFSISGDFSLKVWLDNVPNRKDLITLYGDNGKINLQYHWLDQKFHLSKTDNNGNITNYETNTELVGNGFVVLIQQVNRDLSIDGLVIS